MVRKPERTHLFQRGGPRPVQPRSTISLVVLLGIVIVAILMLFRLGGRSGEPQLTGPDLGPDTLAVARPAAGDLAELERAVAAVERAAAGLTGTDSTAAALADRLVREIAARGGRVEHVVGRPSAPWQVALVPVERDRLVRVEGYAEDLQLPAFVAEVPLR